MSLVFRNALMPSENQQALRLRLDYFMRRLALLTAASLTFAAIPYSVKADTGSIEQSNAQESSLKEDVIFKWYLNGQTQGAGVPNSFGIGSLRPFAIKENSLWFFDSVMNVNLGDVGGSSIINTDVAGTTLSASNRLGYRWLNEDNSKMYGFNFGYDTRNMNTGDADNATVTNKKDVSFQQVALGVETVSENWNLNGYALVPTGDVEKQLNDKYEGGAMNTYGVDMGFDLTDNLTSSVGYYYQHRDQEEIDGSGVKANLTYDLGNGLTVATNISYDEAFDTRVSADFKYRFRLDGKGKDNTQSNVMKALSKPLSNRDVRVHDSCNNNTIYPCPQGSSVVKKPTGK